MNMNMLLLPSRTFFKSFLLSSKDVFNESISYYLLSIIYYLTHAHTLFPFHYISPCHLVVVKGTEFFDGKLGRYVDCPVTDVLQMMGRAGRPVSQYHSIDFYDTASPIIIIVSSSSICSLIFYMNSSDLAPLHILLLPHYFITLLLLHTLSHSHSHPLSLSFSLSFSLVLSLSLSLSLCLSLSHSPSFFLILSLSLPLTHSISLSIPISFFFLLLYHSFLPYQHSNLMTLG